MCIYSSSSAHNFSYLTKSWQILAFRPPYWFTLKEKRPISSNRALKVDSRLGWPNTFLMFWSYFLLKKENYSFPLLLNLYFQQKKAPNLSICHLPTKRSVGGFDVTNRTNSFSDFQGYHEVCISVTL